MTKVTPFLMFNDQLEAAMEFYTATFPDSEIRNVARTGKGFPDTRHPRTAVGIAHGGTRLVLVVVDGRNKDKSEPEAKEGGARRELHGGQPREPRPHSPQGPYEPRPDGFHGPYEPRPYGLQGPYQPRPHGPRDPLHLRSRGPPSLQLRHDHQPLSRSHTCVRDT